MAEKCYFLQCTSYCYTAPMRHVTAVLLFFAIIVGYTHRVALNIAIVEMVVQIKKQKKNEACPLPSDQKTDVIGKIQGGKHDWSEQMQSVILSSFYVGYLPMHFPAGYWCDKYGARIPMLIGCSFSTLFTVISPLCINYLHWGFFVVLRILLGASQGVLYPGVTALLSRWIPPAERATIGGAVYAANNLGIILSNMFTGLTIAWFDSWPVTFYVWGLHGLVFIFFMATFLHSGPEKHPHATEEELSYILSKVAAKSAKPVPWKKLFFDRAIWGNVFGQLGNNYVLFTLITNLPKYMNNVLRYNVKKNAFASSIPFATVYFSAVLSGKLADWAIKDKNANVKLVRVAFTFVSNVVPAGFCLAGGYMKCDRTLALVMFSLAMFMKGPYYSGLKVNVQDITKNHVGISMAIINGTGAISAIITPYVIGFLARDNTFEQWYKVFWIQLWVAFITFVLYGTMTSGRRRDWDYTDEERAALPTDVPKTKWYLEK